MNQQTLRCDIFCTVIDNLGDAGVCLRLARQLAVEHLWTVRLFIDKPDVLFTLAPELVTHDPKNLISVSTWPSLTENTTVNLPDIVIEAFACELPSFYISAMADSDRSPLWINLEYLTAEPWAAECHGLPSPHSTGLMKYFFFPGFFTATGGILIETDYQQRKSAFNRERFLADLGLTEWVSGASNRIVSMFCYEHAPLALLIKQLESDAVPTTLLLPGGKCELASNRNLTIVPIDFMPQNRFDELLWAADINFVRGEDSFVRAQLAGNPFIWNAYPQDAGAHLSKLSAFIAASGLNKSSATEKFMNAWNCNGPFDWPLFSADLNEAELLFRAWSQSLMAQDGLATRLVQFCSERLK